MTSTKLLAGPLYEVVKPSGAVTYTTKKPKKYRYRVFKSKNAHYSKISKSFRSRRNRNAKAVVSQYDSLIKDVAKEFGLEYSLVKAVIHAESSFNKFAVSHAGAKGLMQLMPATAKRFGVKKVFEPKENIRGGSKYLKFLLKRFNNERLALAAYNAGEAAVDKYGGVPPYRETINYVDKVINLKNKYK